MAPKTLIKQLWQDDFFKTSKTFKEIISAMAEKGCHFRESNVALALRNATYLTKTGKGIDSKYAQKIPFVLDIKDMKSTNTLFVDPQRINELASVKNDKFDLSRLVRLCEELNDNFSRKNYISVIVLTRAVLDHVSPIFSYKSFSEVANNFKCEKSIKASLQNLENSSRKIADSYLHIQVRNKEILPTSVQVNFSRELDVLLGEIVRILK